MNKKQNLLAIAFSASFVLAGANVAEANDQVNPQVQDVGQANSAPTSDQSVKPQENKDANLTQEGNQQETPAQVNSKDGQASADEEENKKSGLDALINEEGIKQSYKSNDKKEEDSEATNKKPIGGERSAANEGLQTSEENIPGNQLAPAESSNEPNYSEDEKKVENYRESQMEPGQVDENGDLVSGGPTHTEANNPEMDFKDGVRYKTLEPGSDSPDKKKFGIEIEIDKEKGQRTYTEIGFTNSGLLGGVLDNGSNPANDEGKKLAEGFKNPNYKAEADLNVTPAGRQRNVNIEASEEDLKHINNTANDNTTMAWQGKYKVDNPNGLKATQGESASFTFTVNPWPNENDKLQLIKLEGEYKDKVFVKGQEVDTGIKVENLDDNAKERLVGQVYNPNTGKVVPGASAYIDENGIVKIKMPKGALKQDESGKYVVDEDSIFNTVDYKGIQHLDVRFFARPRTKAEFENVATKNNEFTNGDAKYTETGAGTEKINHKGESITIDKQGIDRYDHYNLIGKFNLNLDDTRHYDQDFKDQEGNKIDEHSSTKVIPGQDFSVEILNPSESGGSQKTAGEMDGAYSRGEATGKLKAEFLDIANKQIADELGVDFKEFITSDEYADKRWTVDGKSDNISKFTIKAPKQAKAGDFLALPVEYTYTNGSTDTHWFHFVVQETNNNKPEYLAEVGPQGNTLVNNPIVTKSETDLKKNQPESYELIGNTFKDNKGNVWNVSIDQKTGAVTATLPLGKEINGGEKLTVPVKVKYTDKTTGEEKTEEIKAQFIATKTFKTFTNEKLTSAIPFETKVEYDETLPEGYFQEFQAGQNGELTTTFVQDTLNGKKGIFQQDGTFKEGESKIVATVTKEATPRIIKIGTKPATTKVEIPYDTEYEVDNNLEAGKTKLINDGEKGEVTITTTRNEDGTVTINKETTKEAKNKKIKIGTKTQGQIVDTDKIPFGYKVEFDPDFYKHYPDAKDNYKIVKPGQEGENTKTWTIVNSQKVGEPKVEIKDPVDAVIKVGQKDYTGTVTNTVTKEVPYTVRVVENPELEAGKSNVKQKGVAGSKTFEYSGEIFNGALKEGTTLKETELTDRYVAPTEHIIEIGTKPVKNEKSVESTVDVDVTYVYDNTKDIGYLKVEDLVKGKVTTVVENEYDPKTGEIKTIEKTVVEPGTRKVIIGTKNKSGEFKEEINKIIPYETEIVFDNTLKAGQKETVQTGENGQTTQTITRTIVNGEVTKEEKSDLTTTKEVKNQIIKVGTMTDGKHSHTEELPFKTTVKKASDLKKGEWRYKIVNGEEQRGKVGSRKTEWTIKNSKVTDTNIVSEEKPVDAIIEIGDEDFTGNVSHEVTEEIPYDVKVIEDPNMIAGISEVVTKGVAGSKTTKYTQAIKNGEADGKLISEVTSTTNPTQQVIKVGTKPAENKKDYSKDVNVKVEYVYDENLDKGVVKLGELTKGKVETKIVNKYDPKTGQVTTTEEEIVTEATQKIIVGTKDFTGTYKYEKTCPLPFEVEIKEDPTLAKGQKIVDQEGEAGSKTTYYEQGIKNGNPDGEAKEIDSNVTKKPKNHIVRIGTKVAESSTVKVVERKLPFDTEYIYDEKLEAGKEVVESEGKVGKEKVTITTKITDGTGEVSEATETITEKEDRKVRVGIKPVVKTEEIPHDTTYKHNPELKAGETKEIQPGTPGKVTITTTFNKETGKLETKVERTEPTNAKYEYGSKTTGEVKVKSEIPFEVEIIEDPTMDAGTHKITQEGEKGEKETTIVIENSVEKSRTDKTTKEAVKKIIRVGTKPNENMCPVPGMPNNPDPIPDSPELPEEDEPKVPDSPNKTPEKPEKPGENKPNESGTPTETPENPTNTDKENPNTQEGSKEDPKKGEEKLEEKEDNRENVSDELSKKRKDRGDLASRKSTNPKTGIGSIAPILTSMGISIAGLLATKKKKKEDE